MNTLLEITNSTSVSNPVIVVLTGILVVFLGMLMITGLLYLSSFLGKVSGKIKEKIEKKKKGKEPENAEKAPETNNVSPEIAGPVGADTEGDGDADEEDEELIAVITAALAAYYSETGRKSSIKAGEVKRICRRIDA